VIPSVNASYSAPSTMAMKMDQKSPARANVGEQRLLPRARRKRATCLPLSPRTSNVQAWFLSSAIKWTQRRVTVAGIVLWFITDIVGALTGK
jgi:hypothetical protein